MGLEYKGGKGKSLSVFTLAMINVIAVDSLKTLPTAAKLEFSLLFYFLLAAIVFFIPVGLIAAELATAWPKKGGSYVWVKEAFGPKWGFLVVWIQWLYNVAWYPTILSVVAGTIAHVFFPGLEHSAGYMVGTVLVMYWLSTAINFFGMRASSFVSSFGAIFGTMLPMLMIIVMATYWLVQGNPATIDISLDSFLPNLNNAKDASYIVTIIFGLIGLEMSAVHANDVKNPTRDYPRALLLSTILILTSLSLASLAISVVIPNSELNIITGLIQAFDFFFNQFNMPGMTKLIAIAIVIGGISSVVTWTIGPSKGLLVASKDNTSIKLLTHENSFGAPVNILIIQGIICTILTLFYLLIPAVQGTYWALTAVTSQLALIMHVVLFAAGIKLRYSKPDVPRPFKIPGGNYGMWIAGGFGVISSIFGIIISFFPPSGIDVGSLSNYQLMLFSGIMAVCLPPFLLNKRRKK